ncbi:extracellular solute-binding protein [Sinomonas sp. JGH33]|uniref:Extracellular solute-binding protein n=1 Tax=Sinomonas terricola TaxID=3110330 RepID=A0ABU5T5S8_9MICC|nr:extracellular solute-binding protein [Sinomonas sp. JGH33]MEA5455023.1 extracellular solute-binding protein [Sinomonas sp. JGH33]
MIRRRDFLGLVSLAAFGAALAGCAPAGSAVDTAKARAGAMDGFGLGTTFKATTPLNYTFLFNDNPAYAYKKDWMFWQKLTSMTNVTLNPTIVPLSDFEQKRSLLLSSGNAPQIIAKTYPGQETPYVSSGAVLPVSDYVNLMPNFQDKVKKWKLEPEIEGLRQQDGKYYVLPGLHEELWPDYTVAVRKDILDQHGITVPTTWDGFRDMLRQLKQAYPNSIPFSDRFNGNSILNIAATAFGTVAGWGLVNGLVFDQSGKKFRFGPASDNFKALLEYFHSLVSEGLMDKESFTQSDDQAVQKFVSGKSFVISTNSQTIVTYRQSMNQSLGTGKFAISKITVPGGPAGNVIGGSRLENGIMLNASVAKNDDFVALIQFIDWLFYSDEGLEFSKWGVKGTTYEKGADGKRTLEPGINYLGLNPKGTKDLRVDYGFSQGNFAYGGTTELLQSMMSDEELTFQRNMKSKTPTATAPPIPYSDADREQATLTLTPLKDTASQNALKFITGQRSLDEFSAFVSELQAKGLSKYEDLANKAYSDYAKSHS